jgi:hypothetical protein
MIVLGVGAACTVLDTLAFEKPSDQQWAVVVQIGAVEIGKGDKSCEIAEAYPGILERHQTVLPHFAQAAVDVNGTQAKRIGQHVLLKRATVTRLVAQPDQLETRAQFQKEMSNALSCVATSQPNQMLDNRRLIAESSS